MEPAITQFVKVEVDDDPFVVAVVPPGFESDSVATGDLLILDHGADGDALNAIYRYSPTAPAGDPAAYAELFATTEQLKSLSKDVNDLAFSRDGTRLFVGSEGQGIVELDSDGNVLGQVDTGGAPIQCVAGMAVDPATGRLWVAESILRQIWSIDLELPSAQFEISFTIAITEFGVLPIELHAPSLAFSPDGQKLVVSDAGSNAANRGWLWVFEKPPLPPPAGRFRRGDADGSGVLDITDPILILGHLFLGSKSPVCLDAADTDDKGSVDITDAIFVLSFLFLGGPAPPAPGPSECGPDVGADELEACGDAAGC